MVAQQGFVPNSYDSALFLNKTNTNITLILLYVDDMIIIIDDSARIWALQDFEMKDLETFNYFLSLEVTSFTNGY